MFTEMKMLRFVCDHCGLDQTFDSDIAAGACGWALVTVNDKEFALCLEHKTELYTFLRTDLMSAFNKIVTLGMEEAR